MQLDYIILAVVGVVGIGGALFLLREAKRMKRNRKDDNDRSRS